MYAQLLNKTDKIAECKKKNVNNAIDTWKVKKNKLEKNTHTKMLVIKTRRKKRSIFFNRLDHASYQSTVHKSMIHLDTLDSAWWFWWDCVYSVDPYFDECIRRRILWPVYVSPSPGNDHIWRVWLYLPQLHHGHPIGSMGGPALSYPFRSIPIWSMLECLMDRQ